MTTLKKTWKCIAMAAAVAASTLVGGCQFGETAVVFTTALGRNDVFKIGKAVCSLAEAKVYLCNYQNIYGNAYGVNLWEHGDTDGSLEEYVKDITISELTRIVIMDELAAQQEITLDEDELTLVGQAAQEYYDSLTEEEISYMGVSQRTLENMYQDYALAQKLYDSLISSVDEEVSDNEARIMEAMQIVVEDRETAKQVQSDLDTGKDFTTVATDYNQASSIEITFGRGDLPSEVEEIAFDLDDDEISAGILADGHYYFIKCINKFNQKLTDEHKETIVKEREKEAFEDVYETFISEQSSILNAEVWENVTIEQNDKITTDSFFAVYDTYFEKE